MNRHTENSRIEWVDIYKCIAIMLMVIGHSTGRFNSYIYQFHMAAFFFVSGYTSNIKNKKLSEIIVNKLFTMILPFLTIFLIGNLCTGIVTNNTLLSKMLPDGFFPGITNSIKMFMISGDIYVQFLGAGWFVLVLFTVTILEKIVLIIVDNHEDNIIYLVINVLIYLTGYYLVNSGNRCHINIIYFDLTFIAIIFYALGICFRNINIQFTGKYNQKNIKILIILLNILVLVYGSKKGNVVDYPSGKFNNPLMDLLFGINGAILLMMISLIISELKFPLKKIMIVIGRNTLSIVFFHFLYFKVVLCAFYKIGIISQEQLEQVVPKGKIADNTWFIFVIFSIVMSLITWEIFKKNSISRFLMGLEKEKYKKIYNYIFKGNNKNIFYDHYNRMKNKIRSIDNKIIIYILALIFLCVYAWYRQGIMCNDELQTRYWSLQGFKTAYKHYFIEHIAKGRTLSTPLVSLTMILGFIGQNNETFKILQIITILATAAVFSILLFKLFKNKRFSILYFVIFVAFLPVTFEHTAPNAFTVLYNIPLLLFLLSAIIWSDYLDSGKGIIASMMLLFIAETSYESFVTMLPLYAFITIYKLGIKNKMTYVKLKYPIGNGIVYVVLYYIFGKIFPSGYSGNQINGLNIIESLKIIKQLLFSSIPGYYIFSNKYKGLYKYYYEYEELFIFLFIACFVIVTLILLRTLYETENRNNTFILLVGIAFCVFQMVCIALPISISQMYQGIVNSSTGFLALPCSYFSYFYGVILICIIIWAIITHINIRMINIFIVFIIASLSSVIQVENNIIANEQSRNFSRLEYIEKFIRSSVIADFKNVEFKCSDLFKTYNALAIHDGYWNSYAELFGLNNNFVNEKPNSNDNRIYYDEELQDFQIWYKDYVCIVSEYDIDQVIIKYSDSKSYVCETDNSLVDGEWYVSYYEFNNEQLSLIDKENIDEITVGSDYNTITKVSGFYDDGWISSESEFIIRTGNNGKIILCLYNPQADAGNTGIIEAYVNDTIQVSKEYDESKIVIELDSSANSIINVKISTSIIQKNTGSDTRELALFINSIEGY